MSKTLTEQWKSGTLKDGFYYVKTRNWSYEDRWHNSYRIDIYENGFWSSDYKYPIVEVIDTVPSYFESAKLYVENRDLKEENEKLHDLKNELSEKIEELKEKLDLAIKALKKYQKAINEFKKDPMNNLVMLSHQVI